jgi:hypothetical protein
MKKLCFWIVIVTACLSLSAQNAKQEALQSLDEAKALINGNQLAKAQEEINYASTKISEILSDELVKFIPDAPAGFTLEDGERCLWAKQEPSSAAQTRFPPADSIAKGNPTSN